MVRYSVLNPRFENSAINEKLFMVDGLFSVTFTPKN